MKRALLFILPAAMMILSSCEGMFPFNDDITKKDIYGEWRPVQYEQNGVTTEPTVEQRDDFIRFNEDKTFVCQEKSVVVEGDYYFNGLDNSINIMTDEDPDNCIPYVVESVNEEEMVYKMPAQTGLGKIRVTLVR
jgi:hypothetical protein